MFANFSFCSAPSFSIAFVVAYLASFIAATHAIVASGVFLMAFFLAFTGFTVVIAIFSDTVGPTVSFIFANNFSLKGWRFWFILFVD